MNCIELNCVPLHLNLNVWNWPLLRIPNMTPLQRNADGVTQVQKCVLLLPSQRTDKQHRQFHTSRRYCFHLLWLHYTKLALSSNIDLSTAQNVIVTALNVETTWDGINLVLNHKNVNTHANALIIVPNETSIDI